jgi:hypothetical protein
VVSSIGAKEETQKVLTDRLKYPLSLASNSFVVRFGMFSSGRLLFASFEVLCYFMVQVGKAN